MPKVFLIKRNLKDSHEGEDNVRLKKLVGRRSVLRVKRRSGYSKLELITKSDILRFKFMYILATKSKKNITKWYQETLLKCKFNTPSVFKLKDMEIKHDCSFRQLSSNKMTSIREKGDTLRLKYDNENHINNCRKNFDHIGKLNSNPCVQQSLCNTNFEKILYKKINQSKHSQTNFSHQSDYLKELSQLSSMMLPHLKQSSIKWVSC